MNMTSRFCAPQARSGLASVLPSITIFPKGRWLRACRGAFRCRLERGPSSRMGPASAARPWPDAKLAAAAAVTDGKMGATRQSPASESPHACLAVWHHPCRYHRRTEIDRTRPPSCYTLSGGEFAALVTALARQASRPHIQLVFRYDIEENASAQSDFKIGLKTMTSDALLLRCCHFYSDTGAARRALPPARRGQCHSAAYPALPPATAGAKGEGRPAFARLSRWGARRQGL